MPTPTPNSSNVSPEPEAAKSVSPESDAADTKLQSTSKGEEYHPSNTPTCEIIQAIINKDARPKIAVYQ